MSTPFIVFSVTFLILRCMLGYTMSMSMFDNDTRCIVYVAQWSTSWLKCTQMTLGISMLNNISTIISSIPMCYARCHNVSKFSLNRVTYMINSVIILAISECDTLRPLVCSFVNSVRDTKWSKQCNDSHWRDWVRNVDL